MYNGSDSNTEKYLLRSHLTKDIGAHFLQVWLLPISYIIQIGNVVHVDVHCVWG